MFVHELLRLLTSRGTVTGDVPAGVRTVIRERLELLTPATVGMLRAAAVVGRTFGVSLAAEVAEVTASTLEEAIGEATAAEVVSVVEPGRYRFDLTKVWPQADFPLLDIGVVELDRNPTNYFAEVEQASFSPANVVPGIGHSPDKMLQFRVLVRRRRALPPRREPRRAAGQPGRAGLSTRTTATGAMRLDDNGGGTVNYEPSSAGGPTQSVSAKEPPLPLEGPADRYDHRDGNDDYSQAGTLFRLMTGDQRQQLFANIAASMKGVPLAIIFRQLAHFGKADPEYAAGVTRALKLEA